MSIEKIKLFVIDVDVTLTDGNIQLNEAGQVSKSFNVKDFSAIESLIKNNFELAFVSELNDRVIYAKMGRNYKIFSNCKNKFEEISKYINEKNLSWDEVAYIGDNETDLECILESSFSGCPSDACQEVHEQSVYAAHASGGRAAVYEIIKYFYNLNKIEW
jgi:3-deoxy-D-manno-octulosonate 8-phosphate phosphatase (KDO 8-P phosphatase)